MFKREFLMKKFFCLLIVVFCSIAVPLFSLPSSYISDDDPTGWGELMIGVHYFPEKKDTIWSISLLMFGKDLTWIENNNLGFGATFGWGGDNLLFSIDSCYYLNFPEADFAAFPLMVRGGLEFPGEISFFASLTGGIELFAGGWTGFYEDDPDAEVCLNLGILGGLYYYKQAVSPAIEIAAGFSTANAYSPSSGYYYY